METRELIETTLKINKKCVFGSYKLKITFTRFNEVFKITEKKVLMSKHGLHQLKLLIAELYCNKHYNQIFYSEDEIAKLIVKFAYEKKKGDEIQFVY